MCIRDSVRANHNIWGWTASIFLNKTEKDPKEDLSGLEKDTDKDGILDINDDCPNVFGVAYTNGCPDRDKDSIADGNDKCPDVYGLKKYKGCPEPPQIDTDKDGIIDFLDKCPYIPGLDRYNGCPIPDTDKDGFNDEVDECPLTPAPNSDNGCPKIKHNILDTLLAISKRIQFSVNSFVLAPRSKRDLDFVAKIMLQNTYLQVHIDGYTSSEGERDKNFILSDNRAMVVRDYLVAKGVGMDRMKTAGHGPSKLLNEERTEAERSPVSYTHLTLPTNREV